MHIFCFSIFLYGCFFGHEAGQLWAHDHKEASCLVIAIGALIFGIVLLVFGLI